MLNSGMLRQLFAEMPDDRVFTAKELADMFERLSPLMGSKDAQKLEELLFLSIKRDAEIVKK